MTDINVELYDIEVELTLLSLDKNGRYAGITSGYRSGHFFIDNIDWIASFDLKDRTVLEPGQTAPAFVTFIYQPQCLIGRLQPGKTFLLREAGQTIGKGIILSLLNFEAHTIQAIQQYGACNDPLPTIEIRSSS